jgi:hypothetical protein
MTEQLKKQTPPFQDGLIMLGLVFFLVSTYLVTTSLRYVSVDETMLFLPTRSLLGRASMDADMLFWTLTNIQGLGGHYYNIKDLAPSLLAIPAVMWAHVLGLSPMRATGLIAPLLTALTGGLMYRLIRRLGYAPVTGILGALTFGLASLAWPYAETFVTQPGAAFGLVVGLTGVQMASTARGERGAFLAGLGLGFASLNAIPTLIVVPVFALGLIDWQAWRKEGWQSKLWPAFRLLVAFGVGLGMFGVLHLLYNWVRFGDPLITGYQRFGDTNRLRLDFLGRGLFGILFSTPHGLIWYAPFVLLLPLGIGAGWRQHRQWTLLLIGQGVLITVLYSSYLGWWGGNAWGTRYLVPIMPALALLLVPWLAWLEGRSFWQRIGQALTFLVLLFSILQQGLTALLDSISSENTWYHEFEAAALSADVFHLPPVLTDLNHSAWPRLLAYLEQGRWDTLWFRQGQVDWVLLTAGLITLALAVSGLVAAIRGQIRRARYGLALQGGLIFALATLMLLRAPHHPSGYLPVETDPMTDLDTLISEVNARAISDDGLVVILPYTYLGWNDRTDGHIPEVGMDYENPLSQQIQAGLARMTRQHPRLWVLSENIERNDPMNGADGWLADRGFAGDQALIGRYWLVTYTFSSQMPALQALDETFGQGLIRLDADSTEVVARPEGGWVNVWLKWQVLRRVDERYTVFVHLRDSHGQVVAQHDGWPQAGYRPTDTWRPGEPLNDRHSLALPPDLPAGQYGIYVGWYINDTRLLLDSNGADSLLLATISLGQ